jgi:c(7)-type cytochrome triheme protein
VRGLILLLLVLAAAVPAAANFNLPPLPSADEYGTIIIDRQSSVNGQQPVSFSHWLHRTRYTCRVCHIELEFQMKANGTEITERGNRTGKFCGACHNGKIAFRHNGNCNKCHNGDKGYSAARFQEFLLKYPMPMTMTGNGVDWSEGLRRGVIKPSTYLKKKSQDMAFDKILVLDAEMSIIPPSVFSHKEHNAWLDCDSCHPDLFNIKMKGTHFTMVEILDGKYCGACHQRVAFPMNDCRRCHPGMREPS